MKTIILCILILSFFSCSNNKKQTTVNTTEKNEIVINSDKPENNSKVSEKKAFKNLSANKSFSGYIEFIKEYPESSFNKGIIDSLLNYKTLLLLTGSNNNYNTCLDEHKQKFKTMNLNGQTEFLINGAFDNYHSGLCCASSLMENIGSEMKLTNSKIKISKAIAAIGLLKYSHFLSRIVKEVIEPTLNLGLFVDKTKEDISKINSSIINHHSKAKKILEDIGMESTIDIWSEKGFVSLEDFNFKVIISEN